MPRQILFVAVAILLSSCGSSRYSQHKVDLSHFEVNQQAIIFLSLKTAPSFLKARTPVSCDLVKIDSKSNAKPIVYRVENPWSSAFNGWSSSLICMMIQPGTYVMENLCWDAGNTQYYVKERGLTSSGLIVFGGFTVKPGSVDYVGHLEVTPKSKSFFGHTKSFTLENIDQWESAHAYVAQKYPSLAPKLTKATYYPSGSLLVVKTQKSKPDLSSSPTS